VPLYGGVPPDAITVMVVVPPLQEMAAPCEADAVGAPDWEMETEQEFLQLFASLTVTE
jgi:hypothetical protein